MGAGKTASEISRAAQLAWRDLAETTGVRPVDEPVTTVLAVNDVVLVEVVAKIAPMSERT